jgi:hypothetical protein
VKKLLPVILGVVVMGGLGILAALPSAPDPAYVDRIRGLEPYYTGEPAWAQIPEVTVRLLDHDTERHAVLGVRFLYQPGLDQGDLAPLIASRELHLIDGLILLLSGKQSDELDDVPDRLHLQAEVAALVDRLGFPRAEARTRRVAFPTLLVQSVDR